MTADSPADRDIVGERGSLLPDGLNAGSIAPSLARAEIREGTRRVQCARRPGKWSLAITASSPARQHSSLSHNDRAYSELRELQDSLHRESGTTIRIGFDAARVVEQHGFS